MFKLQTGYIFSGIITGIVLLISFITSLPDGKLHIFYCNVGQGDAAYIRFPDGRDALIDGGPNNSVINCLSRYMPFWDRQLDLVILSHPEQDHLAGLIAVSERYRIGYLVRSDVVSESTGFAKLTELVRSKQIPQKLVVSGETISIGSTLMSVLWPTRAQLALMRPFAANPGTGQNTGQTVLGAQTLGNLNDASVVVQLSYGNFDVLFPGDADSHVDGDLSGKIPADTDGLEIFKVPHHGSKTGLTDALLSRLYPPGSVNAGCVSAAVSRQSSVVSRQPSAVSLQLSAFSRQPSVDSRQPSAVSLQLSVVSRQSSAVSLQPSAFSRQPSESDSRKLQADSSACPVAIISVGKNSYGHPAPEIITKLEKLGLTVLRTDQNGDIEVISDGRTWSVVAEK